MKKLLLLTIVSLSNSIYSADIGQILKENLISNENKVKFFSDLSQLTFVKITSFQQEN